MNRERVEWIELLREYAPWRRKNHSTKPRSSNWTDSELSSHLEQLSSSAIATYARKGEARRLHDINAMLSKFGANAWRVPNKSNLDILVPLMLFYRAHSAFKTATALGLGGAMTEAMPVLRLCLDYAGYASITHGNFATATVWLYRSDNNQTKAAANNAFWNSKLHDSIARRDAGLADHFAKLYERLSEFGAYKNELSVASELLDQKQGGRDLVEQIRLQDNAVRLDDWLRSGGQVGLCALKIFELLFPTEFNDLGISKRVHQVSKVLRDGGGFQSIERVWQAHIEGRRKG